MSHSSGIGGYDTPELVLKVWAAAGVVPGLFDAELHGPTGVIHSYSDLTVGQVESVARQRGARIERVG